MTFSAFGERQERIIPPNPPPQTEKEQLQQRLRGTEESLTRQLESLQEELARRGQEAEGARRELQEATALFADRLERDLHVERDKASQVVGSSVFHVFDFFVLHNIWLPFKSCSESRMFQ